MTPNATLIYADTATDLYPLNFVTSWPWYRLSNAEVLEVEYQTIAKEKPGSKAYWKAWEKIMETAVFLSDTGVDDCSLHIIEGSLFAVPHYETDLINAEEETYLWGLYERGADDEEGILIRHFRSPYDDLESYDARLPFTLQSGQYIELVD